MTLETIAPFSDDPLVSLPAIASRPTRLTSVIVVTHRKSRGNRNPRVTLLI